MQIWSLAIILLACYQIARLVFYNELVKFSGDEVSVKQLRKLNWRGKQLEGHNDTVFCLDSNLHVAITGG